MSSTHQHRVLPLLAAVALAISTGTAAAVCPAGITPAARHFKLRASEITLKLPDGRTVRQMAYNGTAVGPPLVLNLGEEVSVDIENGMSTPTSTHWHGLYLRNRAWADGVDGVSQAAYAPGTTFRYKFKAEPAGTFWYHAHTGVQFANGLRGPLIVRDPKDPYAGAYDEERVLMLYDQSEATAEDELAALQTGEAKMQMGLCDGAAPPRDYSDIPYYSLYTNGQGWAKEPKTGKPLGAPHVITVQKGKTYRFRTIQGAASWAISVEPTGHAADIIAVDGAETERTRTRAYLFTPGERVDFLLKADQPVGNYWVNVATLNGFNSPAVLHYEGAPDPLRDPKLGSPKLDLGCANQLRPGLLDLSTTTLAPLRTLPQPPPLTTKPTLAKVVYLTDNAVPALSRAALLGAKQEIAGLPRGVKPRAGCPALPNGKPSSYCWSLNWVAYEGSPQPLASTPANASLGSSTYVMDVPLGAVVDVAFINPTAMVHPMHVHGYSLWVLGTGRGNILKPDGSIDYGKLEGGPYMVRDTLPVPNAQPGGDPMGPPGSGMAAMPGAAVAAAAMPGMAGRRLSQAGGMPAMAAMGAMPPAASKPAAMPGMGMGGAMPPAASKQAAGGMPGMASPMAAGKPTIIPVDQAMATMSAPVKPEEFGYTVVRLVADNPGPWAWHCHIDPHAASGMFFALRVGRQWDVPKGLNACAAAKKPSTMAMGM